ncbi:MAG: LysR family transcriptional regulator [Myxococcota bacterium]
MDLNAVLVFIKVVQTGSFTAGAKALGLPKSTASRKVQELERELGAQLLRRTTRKLRLTDVGEVFYARASRIAAEALEAELAVSQLQATPRGTLRLTAPVEFGLALGTLLRSYMDDNPEVKVEVVLTDRVVDLVAEGFDVALRAGPLPDSGLMARRLAPAKRVICASPAYLQHAGTPLRPEELAEHACIAFEAGSESSLWELEGPKGPIRIPIEARLRVNNYEMARQAALTGLGVTVLPTFQCAEDVRAGRLAVVLSSWCSREIEMHAVYASGRHLSPKLRSFLTLLSTMGAPWELR